MREETMEQMKKLAEEWNNAQPPAVQHACPNCGYCPHCGRGGGYYPAPYSPYYPWRPSPTWVGDPQLPGQDHRVWC